MTITIHTFILKGNRRNVCNFDSTYIFNLYIDLPSDKPAHPEQVTYEICEMKDAVELQRNPSYAVPSQVTGSQKKGKAEKMVDIEGDVVTYEMPS